MTEQDKAQDDIPAHVRKLMLAWRRSRIAEANDIADVLGLPRVKAERKKKPRRPAESKGTTSPMW